MGWDDESVIMGWDDGCGMKRIGRLSNRRDSITGGRI